MDEQGFIKLAESFIMLLIAALVAATIISLSSTVASQYGLTLRWW